MIHPRIARLLAGIHAGMIGGFAMTAAMVFFSLLDQRPWWMYPNLLAVNFYGWRVLSSGPGWPTLSGLALQLLVAATAGAIFGLLFGSIPSAARLGLIGIGWGLILLYVSAWAYDRATPFIMSYLPPASPVVAHMIYGVCLAKVRGTVMALRGTIQSVTVAEGSPPEPEANRVES
jgi:hypothetical protein